MVSGTPAPILARLERTHHWMLGLVKVLRRVLVRRRIATSDVAATKAKAQVHPLAAGLEALLATLSMRLYVLNLVQVRTFWFHTSF